MLGRDSVEPGVEGRRHAQPGAVEPEYFELEIGEGRRNGSGQVRIPDGEIPEPGHSTHFRREAAVERVVAQNQIPQPPEIPHLGRDRPAERILAQVEYEQPVQAPDGGRYSADQVVVPQRQVVHPPLPVRTDAGP